MFKLIQISDTHLRASDPLTAPGWEAARAYIRDAEPDLVIHTGDIVRDDPADRADHEFALAELGAIDADWLAVPGNHDVGEGPPGVVTASPALFEAFNRNYGVDRWTRAIPGWQLIGFNTMLFGTGLPEEAEQAAWLEEALAAAPGPIAAFMHKPPFVLAPDEPQLGTATIPHAARAWLWPLIESADVRLIACGHRHEYRINQHGRASIVWCPTTGGLLDERTPPFEDSHHRPGLIEYCFTTSGVFHRLIDLGLRQEPRS